jgi:hypothetical protein
VFVGITALAAGTVATAISVPPVIWPVINLSHYIEHLPLIRALTGLPGDFARWRVRLGPVTRWLGL